MNLLDLIKRRRTIRKFNGKSVSDDQIEKIIDAGIWAPTGCNNQEIRFIVIKSKKWLKKMEQFKPYSKNCGCFILVFIDRRCKNAKIYSKKIHMALPFIDTGLAVQNMVLMAEDLGLKTSICNLTPAHGRKLKNPSILTRAYCKIAQTFDFFQFTKYSLSYFLKKELNTKERYHISAGIIIGHADQRIIDVDAAKHGVNPIERKKPKDHIIKELW